MRDGLWFSEKFTDSLEFLYQVEQIIFDGITEFQHVTIADIKVYGKTLFLDGKMQSAQIDEFVYHEALVHPAMIAHPRPRKVLILGGGEGATLREVLKHDTVKRVVMVDIDGELVELCKKEMPEWSQGAFDDPRSEVIIDDARKFVQETDEKFDVIISDLTEPLEGGPSRMLFTVEFYQMIRDVLNDDGVLAVQSGSADIYYHQFWIDLFSTLSTVFPIVRPYHAYVFSFNLDWAFTVASLRRDPLSLDPEHIKLELENRGIHGLRFYSPSLHRSLFALPRYLEADFEKGGRVLTDSEPFIWKA